MRWLRAFDQWWFGKGSPVTLGVLRILFGIAAFLNFAMLVPLFGDFFTEQGFTPIRLTPYYFGEHPRLNFLEGVTDPRLTGLVLGLTTLAAALMALGLFSRVSAAIVALGAITLQHRNPFLLHGGDVMLRVTLMYLALSPCGAALSFDRVLALRRGKLSGPPPEISMWPQRLIQVQLAIVYLINVWNKHYGHDWAEGNAVWYALNLNEMKRFPLPGFLMENRLFLSASTYLTIAAWMSMGTVVFLRPLRKYAIALGVGAHLFIEYAMNIPLFAFVMLSAYASHFRGEELVVWYERLKAKYSNRKRPSGPT